MRKTSLNSVYELARKDERVLFIGSDLSPGVLDEFKKNIPERFFMEGIAEQHIIGMAAGLAFDGFIPYVNTIAVFLPIKSANIPAGTMVSITIPV